jgi:F-type H+-transporting ATPase subunit epsilon
MNTFTLHLQSATKYERIEAVTSFVGEDSSGGFGLLPRHTRFMTVLSFGLSRFRVGQGNWRFLALPGGLAYFTGGDLYVSSRHYLCGQDYERIRAALEQQFAAEEDELEAMKRSLERLEREMFKRLLEIHRGQPA